MMPPSPAGRTADWKAYLIAATSVQTLTTRVQALGTGDWRANPYATLVNGIRSSQAYYGRLMIAPGGTTIYEADDDFRVDLVPGEEPPARDNGKGSQRDVFELFAVSHRSNVDAFGDATYEGGLWTASTPNEWHAEDGKAPTNKDWMTAAGIARATSARTYYDANAPQGGYQ